MPNITLNQLYDAAIVFLALCGAIAAVGKAVDVIKGWRNPQTTLRADIDRHSSYFIADKRRLDEHDHEIEALRSGLRVTCAGVQVLIDHELHNGNGADMVEASKAINTWLLNR